MNWPQEMRKPLREASTATISLTQFLRRRVMSFRTACCKKSSLIFALLAMAILAAPAFAQTCLQDEYNASGNKQKLNCTANDVRGAQVTAVRDLNGNPLATCFQRTTFSFLADLESVTSARTKH